VPGLVALYDIQPGNGAGIFFQPGARMGRGPCRLGNIAPPVFTARTAPGQNLWSGSNNL